MGVSIASPPQLAIRFGPLVEPLDWRSGCWPLMLSPLTMEAIMLAFIVADHEQVLRS